MGRTEGHRDGPRSEAAGTTVPRKHHPQTSYPLAKVAGEDEVPGEGVGEGRVELQNLEQGLPLDDVQVAVGERAHVGGGVGQCGLLPEHVPEHVTFTWWGGGGGGIITTTPSGSTLRAQVLAF